MAKEDVEILCVVVQYCNWVWIGAALRFGLKVQ